MTNHAYVMTVPTPTLYCTVPLVCSRRTDLPLRVPFQFEFSISISIGLLTLLPCSKDAAFDRPVLT